MLGMESNVGAVPHSPHQGGLLDFPESLTAAGRSGGVMYTWEWNLQAKVEKGGQGRREIRRSTASVLFERTELPEEYYFRIWYVTPAQLSLPAVTPC